MQILWRQVRSIPELPDEELAGGVKSQLGMKVFKAVWQVVM